VVAIAAEFGGVGAGCRVMGIHPPALWKQIQRLRKRRPTRMANQTSPLADFQAPMLGAGVLVLQGRPPLRRDELAEQGPSPLLQVEVGRHGSSIRTRSIARAIQAMYHASSGRSLLTRDLRCWRVADEEAPENIPYTGGRLSNRLTARATQDLAPLAQSAEHIHGKDGVAGSIPAGGSTTNQQLRPGPTPGLFHAGGPRTAVCQKFARKRGP
jgi:hypothetical protein